MLSKVLAVVKTKAALAVLGVALVGGGGTAAYAATGHQLPLIGTHASATEKPDATHEADNHAHTVSIEGVLKAYNAGAATISVQTEGSKPDATEKPESTDTPKSTKTPETLTTMTITVNAKTRVNGDQATTLADLAKNIGHKVQVQADKQSDGSLVAWKVTLQGADGQTGSTNGDGKGNGDTSGQSHNVQGKIASVGAGSFVVKLADGSTKTVTVNAQTQFKGGAHSLTDLKANEKVSVQGTTQSDGSFLATSIEVEGTN